MRGIWQLFRGDLRRGTSNVMAVIVLCGLIVIPSVFTWFNVIASWDPLGNTKNLKVAVASLDEGYTSSLFPIHVNIGSMVESNLRGNDQFDWVITSEEEAIAGTTSGEYYAAMVLPKDFSERMLTFYTAGSQRTQIDFYINDKSNPLAPLITSEGADDLSAKINAQFVQELSDIALSLVSSLVKSLDDPDSQAAFTTIEAQVGAVSVQLRAASGTASLFTSLLESSVPLVNSASSLVGAVESEFTSAAGKIQGGMGASNAAQNALAQATQALSTAFTASTAQLSRLETQVNALFADLGAQSAAGIASLDDASAPIAQLIGEHQALRDRLITDVEPNLPPGALPAFEVVLAGLDAAIAQEQGLEARMQEASARLAAGNGTAQEARGQILTGISAAQSALASANSAYTNDIRPLLDELAATLTEVGAVIGAIPGALSGVTDTTDSAVALLEGAATDTGALAAALTTSADAFERVQQDLAAAIDSGDFSKIAAIIGSDPATLATAIAQPIGLERIPVYPVVSFGAGLAPLYSMLSLWLGALLLAVALRVSPPRQAFDGGPELKLHQQFLGRYGIFLLIGLAQSSLVFLGNIFLVGLDPVHPWLFMLAGWLTSLVFTLIIYTLVVSFGEAGKALAVFLLVLQVAGAGGTYPLPLLPEWFQNVSPFLPGTHSIEAIRAALAGTYRGDYWISIGWLLAFIVPALLLGLLLRKPMIGLNEKMERQLQSTKLM